MLVGGIKYVSGGGQVRWWAESDVTHRLQLFPGAFDVLLGTAAILEML